MEQRVIFSLGYSGVKPEELQAVVEQYDLMVVDIRYSPRSMNVEWTRKRLMDRFGERYVHIRELGNTEYKSGNINYADLGAGLALAREQLEDHSLIILCACSDVVHCHRLPVVALLSEQTGVPIVFWTAADIHRMATEGGAPIQLSFFTPPTESSTPPGSRIYSVNEAADYLGIKPETIKYHIYTSGHLKGQRTGGRRMLTEEELEKFKEKMRKKKQ